MSNEPVPARPNYIPKTMVKYDDLEGVGKILFGGPQPAFNDFRELAILILDDPEFTAVTNITYLTGNIRELVLGHPRAPYGLMAAVIRAVRKKYEGSDLGETYVQRLMDPELILPTERTPKSGLGGLRAVGTKSLRPSARVETLGL